MADLFDNISLEDLSGSETPIVEITNITPPEEIITPVVEKKEIETQVTPTEIVDESAIDLADLTGEPDNTDEEEETAEDEDIKDKTPAKTQGSSPSSQNVMFTSLASALVEAGVLSSPKEGESQVEDVEGLLSAIRNKIQEDRYSDLTTEQKSYLEAIENGVPQQEYQEVHTELAQYKALDEEVIRGRKDVQQELIKRNFVAKGLDEATAIKYANLAMTAEGADQEAILAKNALVAAKEKQIQDRVDAHKAKEAARLKSEQDAIAALKSKVNEAPSIIPGLSMNAITKDKIFNSMVTPVRIEGKNPRNEVMEAYASDENYKLKLHAMHVATKGFTDFSKLTKVSKKQAVSDLEKLLNSKGTTTTPGTAGGTQTHITQGATTGSMGKHLNFLKLN